MTFLLFLPVFSLGGEPLVWRGSTHLEKRTGPMRAHLVHTNMIFLFFYWTVSKSLQSNM
jgi:hypothetical protein